MYTYGTVGTKSMNTLSRMWLEQFPSWGCIHSTRNVHPGHECLLGMFLCLYIEPSGCNKSSTYWSSIHFIIWVLHNCQQKVQELHRTPPFRSMSFHVSNSITVKECGRPAISNIQRSGSTVVSKKQTTAMMWRPRHRIRIRIYWYNLLKSTVHFHSLIGLKLLW